MDAFLKFSLLHIRINGLRVSYCKDRGLFCKVAEATRPRAGRPPMLRILWWEENRVGFNEPRFTILTTAES